MIKSRYYFVILLSALAIHFLVLSGYVNIYNQIAYAHNFVPNDSATFLTRVYRAGVELSLASNNFPSNVTLSMNHAEDAVKLMDDAYYGDEDIIDDSDFISKYKKALSDTNSTVHALVLANIVDQVLREYGDAFDIDYDLTNMSNMIMTADNTAIYDMNSSSSSRNSMNMTTDSNIADNSANNNNSSNLVNIDNYQSAQKLSEIAYQIFKNELQPLLPSSSLNNNNNDNNNNNTNKHNNGAVILKVDKNLVDMKNSVNNKASAQELMALVHTQIHPNLQLAYNLKLIQQ